MKRFRTELDIDDISGVRDHFPVPWKLPRAILEEHTHARSQLDSFMGGLDVRAAAAAHRVALARSANSWMAIGYRRGQSHRDGESERGKANPECAPGFRVFLGRSLGPFSNAALRRPRS